MPGGCAPAHRDRGTGTALCLDARVLTCSCVCTRAHAHAHICASSPPSRPPFRAHPRVCVRVREPQCAAFDARQPQELFASLTRIDDDDAYTYKPHDCESYVAVALALAVFAGEPCFWLRAVPATLTAASYEGRWITESSCALVHMCKLLYRSMWNMARGHAASSILVAQSAEADYVHAGIPHGLIIHVHVIVSRLRVAVLPGPGSRRHTEDRTRPTFLVYHVRRQCIDGMKSVLAGGADRSSVIDCFIQKAHRMVFQQGRNGDCHFS